MKQALQSRRYPPAQTALVTSRPPPIGGWNTRDSLAQMKPTDAIVLDNWIARPSKVELRKGTADHLTGLSTNVVKTLMAYRPASGAGKLFAVAGTGIYDATTAGTVGASLSTVTDAAWQHTNFATSAGQFLCAVNGADDYRYYDGSSWTTVSTFTFGAGTLATNLLIGICAHQSRLYFIRKQSLRFYYLSLAGTISGTVLEFNLDQVFPLGGHLVAMGSWTFDGGDGPEDRAVFITSEGEVAVYTGTDPADVTKWRLVGTFYIGRPVGRRCLQDYAGDLILLTDQGLFPLSKALATATVDKSVALTDRIAPTIARAASSLFSTFGWQLTLHTKESLLLINSPDDPHTIYCMELQSKGWSRFTGITAYCMEVFNGKLYLGMEGKVAEGLVGTTDFDSAIEGVLLTAFDYFNARGQEKHIELVRPHMEAQGGFDYFISGLTDFDQEIPIGVMEVMPPPGFALWDTSLWDTGAWTADSYPVGDWRTLAVRPGFNFAFFLRVSTDTVTPSLLAIDYAMHRGGVL